MKISEIIWLQKIIDKIAVKHGLTKEEVEEVFANRPQYMSIDEASEFWDSHSIADVPTRVVEMEYAPQGHTTLVAIEDHLLDRLTQSARERGVSVETLVNLWLQERLTA